MSESRRIPVPAHVHYELLLRVLERQTFPVVDEADYANRPKMQELVNSLRKALSQQQQLEETWRQRGFEIDYRWNADDPG
ncbi:MAG: DUF5340 domain-containing protein [Synechococcaceae cyanobacterium RM1_1_27]|nr:DUF5340 domain-containing protein [Synechococcaceae cyanobacterium SM2_3_2]NJO85398.1 DUF5340 domain-containing protein [Synechococcaceae cyanobacterium RM1_1_27]